jgi:selenophosphate synthetase-related protein
LIEMSSPPLTPIQTNRDVLIFQFDSRQAIIIGCDSAGGIGPKPLDRVRVDGYTLGKITARVALMEVLSTGAKPFCVVDTLSVEPEPTGNEILRGIRDEAETAGLDPKLAVMGSSEKNFAVKQTGIGVTVIGIIETKALRIGVSEPEDLVLAVGTPCVGDEVVQAEKRGKTADTSDVLKLRDMKFVHEIIPVGSEGIAHEIRILAESSKLKFRFTEQPRVNVKKSAGPATVLLVSLPEDRLAELKHAIGKPVNVVGQLF